MVGWTTGSEVRKQQVQRTLQGMTMNASLFSYPVILYQTWAARHREEVMRRVTGGEIDSENLMVALGEVREGTRSRRITVKAAVTAIVSVARRLGLKNHVAAISR